jgi:hypothetical protein
MIIMPLQLKHLKHQRLSPYVCWWHDSSASSSSRQSCLVDIATVPISQYPRNSISHLIKSLAKVAQECLLVRMSTLEKISLLPQL